MDLTLSLIAAALFSLAIFTAARIARDEFRERNREIESWKRRADDAHKDWGVEYKKACALEEENKRLKKRLSYWIGEYGGDL